MSRVTSIFQEKAKTNEGTKIKTIVYLGNEDFFYVEETPEVIISRLNQINPTNMVF